MTAKVIVFEGIDGSGKTSQSKLLRDELPNSIYVHSPFHNEYDNGYGCKLIRDLLQSGLAIKEPETFQKIYVDNRKQWLIEQFPYLRQTYEWIIIDRWNLSTWIYGSICGISYDKLMKLTEDQNIIDYQILFRPSNQIKYSDSFEKELYLKASIEYECYINDLQNNQLSNAKKQLTGKGNLVIEARSKTIYETHKLILQTVKSYFNQGL